MADLARLQEEFAQVPALRQLAEKVVDLEALWPLSDATQIDNDVKYSEEMQVRVTREIAEQLSGADVTIADAEYVYEGAVENIPGRPDIVTQTLALANDAYDEAADISSHREARQVLGLHEILGQEWDDDVAVRVESAVRAVLDSVGAEGAGVDAAGAGATDQTGSDSSAVTADEIVPRLALSAAAYASLVREGAQVYATATLFLNELNEIQGLPRVFVSLAQAARFEALAGDVTAAGVQAFAAEYVRVATVECGKHKEDVLWNPAEAKKRAKEEDEAKNKAALAAKFAHVDNDEGKEPVEL